MLIVNHVCCTLTPLMPCVPPNNFAQEARRDPYTNEDPGAQRIKLTHLRPQGVCGGQIRIAVSQLLPCAWPLS
jgi:hypothetical protein